MWNGWMNEYNVNGFQTAITTTTISKTMWVDQYLVSPFYLGTGITHRHAI
jgi:hypothetical protein